MKTTTLSILSVSCLAFIMISHRAEAVSPAPDGNYPGQNTAEGADALLSLTNGLQNTAIGAATLLKNTTGNYNTAVGDNALRLDLTGSKNTAVGNEALYNSTGSENVALGLDAGRNLTSGSGNVYIGANVRGVSAEDNTTRIKNIHASVATGRAVYVDSDNKIGTLSSSRRYKEEIKSMNQVSETLFALKPVTFRYKKEVDPTRMLSFGLIAEEVAQINPDLITRDEQGKPQTVRYDAINAMLLNEFLKEHRTVQELQSNAAKQEAIIAGQQKQIDALTAGLQKVRARLELSKPAQQTVRNDQ